MGRRNRKAWRERRQLKHEAEAMGEVGGPYAGAGEAVEVTEEVRAVEAPRDAVPAMRYFTGEEIADVLRVHVKTVERWRRRLGLPCLRLGGTIRYELSDVCDWASARKEG
jgi:excisionase family DNA binding protein